MDRQTSINLGYFALAVLAVLWMQSLWVESQQVERLSYSEFQEQLKSGRIKAASNRTARRVLPLHPRARIDQ